MDKEMMAKVDEMLKASGMQELNMEELDKICGGWEPSQLTADELHEYRALREEYQRALNAKDRDRLVESLVKMRAFGDRMTAKYGNDF